MGWVFKAFNFSTYPNIYQECEFTELNTCYICGSAYYLANCTNAQGTDTVSPCNYYTFIDSTCTGVAAGIPIVNAKNCGGVTVPCVFTAAYVNAEPCNALPISMESGSSVTIHGSNINKGQRVLVIWVCQEQLGMN